MQFECLQNFGYKNKRLKIFRILVLKVMLADDVFDSNYSLHQHLRLAVLQNDMMPQTIIFDFVLSDVILGLGLLPEGPHTQQTESWQKVQKECCH